jgi:hypothetical protein
LELKTPFAKKAEDPFAWNDKLNAEMKKDGDRNEEYKNEKLEGIEASFFSMAGEITVSLRQQIDPRKGMDASVVVEHRDFSKDQRVEAEALFAELKKAIDTSATSGESKEEAFKKTAVLLGASDLENGHESV